MECRARGTPLIPILIFGLITGVVLSGERASIPSAPVAKDDEFKREIRPVLEAHCFKCHSAEKKKGKLDLSAFADEKSIRAHRKTWQRVITQIKSLEMPPDDQPRLPAELRERLLRWLEGAVNTVDCTNPADRDPGPPLLRRLNRAEYTQSVRDLFGIEFNAAAAVGMAEDPSGQGFDTLANALTLSPVLMEKYFAAADHILDRLIPPPGAEIPKGQTWAGRREDKKAADQLLFIGPGRYISAREAARFIVKRYASRAFRHPLTAGELERLLKVFDQAEKHGAPFQEGLRYTLKAVLVSPQFLFRFEEDRGNTDAPYRVSDHELATRLSYFLWSTLPDDELVKLADEKRLADPVVLEEQVRRMLKSPKAKALTENFAAQWLQLRKLAEARPSQEFFPTFNNRVREAMHNETAMFFDKLREEDRSVLELLEADYTYVNEELAKHYGFDGVKGGEMRRVQLKPGDHRGGLLGMGSILAMTSHTSRTSPTMRGKWVLEVIFGAPPPPPPPNAGQINEKPEKGQAPKSFRELIAMHAKDAACASCHNKMDPLGFALDNYDAVGRWRVDHGGQPLDTRGKMPGGETFNGADELKQLILSRKDAFERNMTEQLFTYALGRELRGDDECAVRETLTALQQDGHKFSTLVLGVVRSHSFQYRRNSNTTAAE